MAVGKRQVGLDSPSGTVMGISRVTTETVFSAAGGGWVSLARRAIPSRPSGLLQHAATAAMRGGERPSGHTPLRRLTHLCGLGFNRRVCSQETQARSNTLFRAGEDV